MKTKERFNFLICRYVDDYLSLGEKDEFFKLICTGDYDNIIGDHFVNSITQFEMDQNQSLRPDCYNDIKKMILDSDKKYSFI